MRTAKEWMDEFDGAFPSLYSINAVQADALREAAELAYKEGASTGMVEAIKTAANIRTAILTRAKQVEGEGVICAKCGTPIDPRWNWRIPSDSTAEHIICPGKKEVM